MALLYKNHFSRPLKVLQFGEGNFLRSFVDWMIAVMNKKDVFNGDVFVIQPIEEGKVDILNHQNGQYHLILKGLENGTPVRKIELIDCIKKGLNPYENFEAYMKLAESPELRFIVSNTTEAGIIFSPDDKFSDTPAKRFPAKLTQFLYRRFLFFKGDQTKGFIFLPCELIDRNGDQLKEAILRYIALWNLGRDFEKWIVQSNYFANTLVDRIVPGLPSTDEFEKIQKEINCTDALISEGEIFHLWVIEGDPIIKEEFPADRAGLNVRFVSDVTPYRDRKVTLLNGSHTVLAPVAFLYGLDTVREAVEDTLIGKYVQKTLFEELLPTLSFSEEELIPFALEILNRFKNPYINHRLTSIMLNSFSKYKTRDLPALKKYIKDKKKLPEGLILGLAAMCICYKGNRNNTGIIDFKDDKSVLSILEKAWNRGSIQDTVSEILGAVSLWGNDLNRIEGLASSLANYLTVIEESGIKAAVQMVVK